MTRAEVYEICKRVAPKHGFDPLLILAMCEQESSNDPTEMRLENGFYRKYIRPMRFASTVGVCFSTSWGLMQVMGVSLFELGYFAESERTPQAFTNKFNEFITNPEAQIDCGCRWLKHKMETHQTENIERGLRFYNGSNEYPPLVFKRYDELRKVYP